MAPHPRGRGCAPEKTWVSVDGGASPRPRVRPSRTLSVAIFRPSIGVIKKNICNKAFLPTLPNPKGYALHIPTVQYECDNVLENHGTDLLDAISMGDDITPLCWDLDICGDRELCGPQGLPPEQPEFRIPWAGHSITIVQ